MMGPAEPVLIMDNVYIYATVPYYNWGTFLVCCLQLDNQFVVAYINPTQLRNL
jgi:hypothetical protein